MAGTSPAGRVTLSSRAIERTLGALAAEELGSPAHRSGVRLHDDAGRLGVTVTATAAIGPGRTVIEAAEAAQRRVLADGPVLTGAQITVARIRVTGVHDVRASRRVS